jgi:hypothetical protein
MKREKKVPAQSKSKRLEQKKKKKELLAELIKEKTLEDTRRLVKEHKNSLMTLDQLFRLKLKEAAFQYFDEGNEAFQVIIMLPELSSKTVYSYEKEHKALNGKSEA